MNTCTFISA